MDERFRCQCQRRADRCEQPMTQEDLLCDICRKGCTHLFHADGQPSQHVILVLDTSRAEAAIGALAARLG
jgi:hypothetical protein